MEAKTELNVPKKKPVNKKPVVKPKALPAETPKEVKVRPARETVPMGVTTLVNFVLSVKGAKYLTRVQRAIINKIPKDTFKRLAEERLGKDLGRKTKKVDTSTLTNVQVKRLYDSRFTVVAKPKKSKVAKTK